MFINEVKFLFIDHPYTYAFRHAIFVITTHPTPFSDVINRHSLFCFVCVIHFTCSSPNSTGPYKRSNLMTQFMRSVEPRTEITSALRQQQQHKGAPIKSLLRAILGIHTRCLYQKFIRSTSIVVYTMNSIQTQNLNIYIYVHALCTKP